MLNPETIAALSAELEAIDKQLEDYQTLLEKRRDIKAILDRWSSPKESSKVISVDNSDLRDHLRNKINDMLVAGDESKAFRIVQAARRYLLSKENGKATFLEVFNAIPSSLFGEMKHPREYARTALSRKGGEAGVVYQDADNVHLTNAALMATAQKDNPGRSFPR